MRKARWLAEWRHSEKKPVFYHCISWVVDRRFVLGVEEKERFRTLMRMQEKFTGCRVVSYCLMDNHFHLLLEVPSMAEGGLSDGELLRRLWEDRFKSVIVEDGVAAKTISAYIDLNPVRAGIVKDPADYRWSSYGEAIGGGAKGNGKTARAGLVRALRAHKAAERMIRFGRTMFRGNTGNY